MTRTGPPSRRSAAAPRHPSGARRQASAGEPGRQVGQRGVEPLLVRLDIDAGRHVGGVDRDPGAPVTLGERPGHGHPPGGVGVVGLELDPPHDALALDQLVDRDPRDVGVVSRLGAAGGSLVVAQRHREAATGPEVDVGQLAGHVARREPRHQGVGVDEGGVDLVRRRSDVGDGPVDARHLRTPGARPRATGRRPGGAPAACWPAGRQRRRHARPARGVRRRARRRAPRCGPGGRRPGARAP